MTKSEAAEAIKELARRDVGLDLWIKESDIYPYMTFDDVTEQFAERAIDEQCEIIYYSRAIEYLSKNDPSLRDSLELAAEYGYELGSLSSEVLATLLNNQNMRQEWQDLEREINDILDEVEDDDDDE